MVGLNPEMASLKAEAARLDAPEAPQVKAEASEGAASPVSGSLRPIVAPAVALAGGMACRRFGVSSLDPAEVDALADAVAGVVQAYGLLDKLDPKTAAWLGLATVGLGIIANRRPLQLPPPPADPEPQPAADAAQAG